MGEEKRQKKELEGTKIEKEALVEDEKQKQELEKKIIESAVLLEKPKDELEDKRRKTKVLLSSQTKDSQTGKLKSCQEFEPGPVGQQQQR